MNKEYIEINKNTFPTPFSKRLNGYMQGWDDCLNSVLQHKVADVEEKSENKGFMYAYTHCKQLCNKMSFTSPNNGKVIRVADIECVLDELIRYYTRKAEE